MNVELLYHTPDPQRAVATAARLCYAPVGAAELMETLSEERIEKVLRTILESGHFSTLEHASYTFAIDGVSRAMTHQLVRHRLASYNQQSQRYVTFREEPEFIVPDSVVEAGAAEEYDAAVRAAFAAYADLVERGVPAEDARYLLPNACETKIVVTMNIRERSTSSSCVAAIVPNGRFARSLAACSSSCVPPRRSSSRRPVPVA